MLASFMFYLHINTRTVVIDSAAKFCLLAKNPFARARSFMPLLVSCIFSDSMVEMFASAGATSIFVAIPQWLSVPEKQYDHHICTVKCKEACLKYFH